MRFWLKSDLNDNTFRKRGDLADNSDADLIILPGIYSKPVANYCNNLPVQTSGLLYVFMQANDAFVTQIYQTQSSLFFRRRGYEWKQVVDSSELQDSYFEANRGTLTSNDDADSIIVPGSYSKPASITVNNLPTQNAGYLYIMTTPSTSYQLYQTAVGGLYYRTIGHEWVMVARTNDYNHRLFNKTLVGLGDSLMYGQGMSASERSNYTWIALLEKNLSMTTYNYGVSGSAIAYTKNEEVESMAIRIDRIISDLGASNVDYFVLEGGANDYTNSTPLGSLDRTNTDKTTYYGALNYIINQIKTTWPKCRILLMTNYDRKNRSKTVNGILLNDEYYVNAMLDYAHFRGIPVFDNYHELGFSIKDYLDSTQTGSAQYLDNWFLSIAYSQHITIEGMAWLAPIYAKKLESI